MSDKPSATSGGKLAVRDELPAKLDAPKPGGDISRELIKAIAMEIGKSTVAYVEVMYPEAIKAASSTFKLSLRNHIHNEIVSMAELHDEVSMREAIKESAGFRKQWVAQYRKMRRTK